MSLVGKSVGPYRIQSLLGEGGMGDVYVGEHEKLNRPVAIKTLKPELIEDPELLQRFFSEARAANLIRHENIVEITDLLSEPDGSSYMVMELLDGLPLEDLLEHESKLPANRAVAIMTQVADALEAAHNKEIIHRDLKPANIFLIKRANTSDYVKVLDFGIARLMAEPQLHTTKTGQFWGTPLYMSPEQVVGKQISPSADIYAFGVILFEMLTGQLPFNDDSLYSLMNSHLNSTPPTVASIVPDVPAKLSELVAQCMAKLPEDRPASMTVLRKQLAASIEGITTPAGFDDTVLASSQPGTPKAQATPDPGKAKPSSDPRKAQATQKNTEGYSVVLWIGGLLIFALIVSGVLIFVVKGGAHTPNGSEPALASKDAGIETTAGDAGATTENPAVVDAKQPKTTQLASPAELRARLNEKLAKYDEPLPPEACQTKDPKLLDVLIRGYDKETMHTVENASEGWQATTEFWTWQAWRFLHLGQKRTGTTRRATRDDNLRLQPGRSESRRQNVLQAKEPRESRVPLRESENAGT